MADLASLVPPALVAATSEAGDRGSLAISPRAVERIAEATAVQAPGVIRQEATFGRGLPKAKVQLAGQRVRVDVELAVEWGFPLADLAAEVRDRLNRTIGTLTGLEVDNVSVDIAAVELPDTPAKDRPRRVV